MAAIVGIIAVAFFVAISIPLMPSMLQMFIFPPAVAFIIKVIEAIFAIVPGKVLIPVVFRANFHKFEKFFAPFGIMLFSFIMPVCFSLTLMMPLIPVMG